MDEGGEALSPLQVAKAHKLLAQAAAAQAAVQTAATPGSGSVGGAPPPQLAAAPMAGASSAARGRPSQREQPDNDEAGVSPAADGQAQQEQEVPLAAGGGSGALTSPLNYSTMAVDMAPAGPDEPQPTASGQPSHLPPPGAVAAVLAALEAQQAAHNGASQLAPPAAATSLGDAGQPLQPQNGYATHANSAIGNGHMAQTSPGASGASQGSRRASRGLKGVAPFGSAAC